MSKELSLKINSLWTCFVGLDATSTVEICDIRDNIVYYKYINHGYISKDKVCYDYISSFLCIFEPNIQDNSELFEVFDL